MSSLIDKLGTLVDGEECACLRIHFIAELCALVLFARNKLAQVPAFGDPAFHITPP